MKGAALVYLTGGDQTQFMEVVGNTPIQEAIRQAYQNGAIVAGTSAGAAVMSKKMITGNEFKHPEYTGDFRTIEAQNVELTEGLGLLPPKIIVDQHFVYRMRMNRLITVALENPRYQCIGIDESTAIVVKGKKARVVGAGQVIDLTYFHKKPNVKNGLLGGNDLRLHVWLPGQKFKLVTGNW
ncbi:MAG: cyanophycinase [Saprospirales bacterium]|nr:cyanophycinase [Saprospirales bacterium]